ncbi:MAG: cupin domain-containing protein [Gammaproteobacteria bacterium]|nr:cupin domain-containing protein [Gammaproteobacteria bacterium]
MHNIYDAIPKNLKTEVFDLLLDSEVVKIERIVSKGHKSPSGWYDQDDNEWILLVKGAAILSFADKSSITLKEGDFYNIPAHKKHRVKWTDPDIETVWLAIQY